MEYRRAEFNNSLLMSGPSARHHGFHRVSTEMQMRAGGDQSSPESGHRQLMSKEGSNCSAIPASFAKFVLGARANGQFRGLGFFHFYWQPAENPASLAALGLSGPPRGVLVHYVPQRPDRAEEVMRTNDIILAIDGFPSRYAGITWIRGTDACSWRTWPSGINSTGCREMKIWREARC